MISVLILGVISEYDLMVMVSGGLSYFRKLSELKAGKGKKSHLLDEIGRK